jgi:hypothetical protein
VAPGEGKRQKDIMAEDKWDIKAFPHPNNPNGSNGKDQERKVRLTDQNFFILLDSCSHQMSQKTHQT